MSGFQLQFSSEEIFTPSDTPDMLVAMNPAARQRNIQELEPGVTLVVDEDQFTEKDLQELLTGNTT